MARLLIVLLSVGCSESIDSTGQDGQNSCQQSEVQTSEAGVRTMTINAMDYEIWVKLHLDSGVTDDENDWDIALRRYAFRINGGASGSGYGLAQWQNITTFSDTTRAPEDKWLTDQADAEDTVFADWYDYNGETHELTPKDRIYFVRGHDGMRYYAVRVMDYYTPPPASDSGCVTLSWKAIAAPENMPENIPGVGALPSNENTSMNAPVATEADDGDPSAGCYLGPPTHTCDCSTTRGNCEDSNGVWTDQCACDENS